MGVGVDVYRVGVRRPTASSYRRRCSELSAVARRGRRADEGVATAAVGRQDSVEIWIVIPVVRWGVDCGGVDLIDCSTLRVSKYLPDGHRLGRPHLFIRNRVPPTTLPVPLERLKLLSDNLLMQLSQ